MRNLLLSIVLFGFLLSCKNDEVSKATIENGFGKPFKEQKMSDYIQFDSLTNIYSNFKYKIAFDAPDNWETDYGSQKHTIFRTYQPDSAISFSINVIELKSKLPESLNMWDIYKKYDKSLDSALIATLEVQLNSPVKLLDTKKSYIKNNIAVRRVFLSTVKDLNTSYSNTDIMYQIFMNNCTYTFSLNVPTLIYNQNKDYYNNIFRNIYILNDPEVVQKMINKNRE